MTNHRRAIYKKTIHTLHTLILISSFTFSFLPFIYNIKSNTFPIISFDIYVLTYTLSSYIAIYIISIRFHTRHISYNMPPFIGSAIYSCITAIATCAILCLITLLLFKKLSPLQPLIFLSTTPIIYIPAQLLFSLFFSYMNNRPNNQRHILIIGTNQSAIEFAKSIERQTLLGFKILGYVDDSKNPPLDLNILGSFGDFQKIIRENIVDAVAIKIPVRTFYDEIANLISIAEEQGIATYCLNNFFESNSCAITPRQYDNTNSIIFHSAPLEDWKMLLKRITSITGATVAILLTLPLMIVIGIAIYIQDPGPIFYSQKRIGYHKRIFNIYKFRTMYKNSQSTQKILESSNEMDGPVFKIKNDPRIFFVGRIIRRFSLDELPQFFNVLKGDMSLVGPRPLALRDYRGFREDWLRKRFSVPPGMTCYWQSMINRNDIPFKEWMNLDMQYINNWSLWEDIKICLKTVHTIMKGKGV